MINKGKIIFINGYWQNTVLGRIVIGSSAPNKGYWNNGNFDGYAKAAMNFFGLNENIQEACVCLDASSLIVLDDTGAARAQRGADDFTTYQWAGTLYRKVSDQFGYGLPETSGLRNKVLSSQIHERNLNSLTKDMNKENHAFYLVGHSEGCAYAAGLGRLLKEQGWQVNFIVYLSSYDSGSFSNPQGIKAYQLGYAGKTFGDWATNNNPVHSGVEKVAIVYKDFGSQWNNFSRMHGSTKGEEVWIHLSDLRTLTIRTGRTYGTKWASQVAHSTPNHTVFAMYNGISLDPEEYINEENSKINQYNYKTMHKYKNY
ncbi:hypothetical protein [Taibaiella chishuiensis]|uniref:Uncharacterized protein n=1 Tax=Taibaiella chishuiensis TaxID=1434707 RepID=A0A2P8D0S6_9BACT|nr:hypothetical protein [Taibaiella chishuiensis]PSK90819.1 hypothetical protein B0I18_107231 [Taibaiella chishuiensis]